MKNQFFCDTVVHVLPIENKGTSPCINTKNLEPYLRTLVRRCQAVIIKRTVVRGSHFKWDVLENAFSFGLGRLILKLQERIAADNYF